MGGHEAHVGATEPCLIGFPIPQDREAHWKSRLAAHFECSDAAAGEYSRLRRVALGAAVLGRTRIYLDTKFWVYLRDASVGNPAHPTHSILLARLRELVESGRAICPLADCAFLELLKQGDRERRLATARVMDELSQGVSLRSHDERLRAEVLHFLRRHTSHPDNLYPLAQMVWTRAGFVLGELHPSPEGIPQPDADAMARTFDDIVWMSRLEEMLSDLEHELDPEFAFYRRLADQLNLGQDQHADELTSFRSAYHNELRGAIDGHNEIIVEVFPYLYQQTGATDSPTEPQKWESARILGNAIYEALARDSTLRDLPTINIQAGIHASIRWDKPRRYAPNDWLDILHAAAGIPYCDVFLTERSLATQLQSSHLAYNDRYETLVLHTSEAAIANLE